jgi:hypothetical protein
MNSRFRSLLFCLVLALPASAQQEPVSPSHAMTPWYEQGLKQLTENKPDVGTEIEARRQRLLEASIRSRWNTTPKLKTAESFQRPL